MTMQIRIIGRFEIPDRGMHVIAIAPTNQEPIRIHDRFVDEATGASMTVRWVDIHTRVVREGIQYGLAITESHPGAIQADTVLTKATQERLD